MEFESDSIKFKHPFSMIVAGPTSTGKTLLVFNILENFEKLILFKNPFRQINVLWCYNEWQDMYEKKFIKNNINIKYEEGISLTNDNYDIIVIDDLMRYTEKSKDLMDFFTTKSHHKKVSIIFIVQNLFFQSHKMRNITLNTMYVILTNNRQDKLQIKSLANRIYPDNTSILIESYEEAMKLSDYGYLLIDNHPNTPSKLRLRTQIFGEVPIIYVPKNV